MTKLSQDENICFGAIRNLYLIQKWLS